jgi:hypothetical protein
MFLSHLIILVFFYVKFGFCKKAFAVGCFVVRLHFDVRQRGVLAMCFYIGTRKSFFHISPKIKNLSSIIFKVHRKDKHLSCAFGATHGKRYGPHPTSQRPPARGLILLPHPAHPAASYLLHSFLHSRPSILSPLTAPLSPPRATADGDGHGTDGSLRRAWCDGSRAAGISLSTGSKKTEPTHGYPVAH